MRRIYALFAIVMVFPFLGISQRMNEINKPTISGLDEVAPFSEGLAAVRKGNQWGFIDKKGKLTIDFRSDLVWNKNAEIGRKDVKGIRYPEFKNGLCAIQQTKDEGILFYGFIDTKGEIAIEPEYLNITEFDQNNAIGIFVKKTFKGQNEIKLDVYDYSFMEVLINTSGEIVWPISEREHSITAKRRYQMPELRSVLIAENLLGVKVRDNNWEIRMIGPQNQKP